MRDPLVDALLAEIVERRDRDAEFRRAWADLRETCAFVIDPRHADRDLARLLSAYSGGDLPISPRFEVVLRGLPLPFARVRAGEEGVAGRESALPTLLKLLGKGIESELREHFALRLEGMPVLDPWVGDGTMLKALDGARGFGSESDIAHYAGATPHGRIVFADSFRLPDRSPTFGFTFSDDENTERIAEQQALDFRVIVTDLRNATRPDARAQRRVRETYGSGLAAVRWMTDRLAPKGIVAFVSDGSFIDEPSLAGMRASLEKEFGHIAHLQLGESLALTFLVRGGKRKGIFSPLPSGGEGLGVRGNASSRGAGTGARDQEASPYLEGEGRVGVACYADCEWRQLEPTPKHVWRTEILAPEWENFLPLVGERGAIFTEAGFVAPDGLDAPEPGPKGTRRVLQRPFTPVWRSLDRLARRQPWPAEKPTIVVLQEPYGVVAAIGAIDRRFGGPKTTIFTVSGVVSPSALRRFRSAYGAGIVERDVFAYALALLHHPSYRERYREDLRRGVPRIPLLDPERLAALSEIEEAPAVGPGSAYGTGWLDPDDFEPGTVADYDDPFASPYARSDVKPGFLLFAGLGAALYRVEVDIEKLRPYVLEGMENAEPDGRLQRTRFSKDRTKIDLGPHLSLSGVPPEAFNVRIGRLSPLEWILKNPRSLEYADPIRIVKRIGQAIAAASEIDRLSNLVATVDLENAG